MIGDRDESLGELARETFKYIASQLGHERFTLRVETEGFSIHIDGKWTLVHDTVEDAIVEVRARRADEAGPR